MAALGDIEVAVDIVEETCGVVGHTAGCAAFGKYVVALVCQSQQFGAQSTHHRDVLADSAKVRYAVCHEYGGGFCRQGFGGQGRCATKGLQIRTQSFGVRLDAVALAVQIVALAIYRHAKCVHTCRELVGGLFVHSHILALCGVTAVYQEVKQGGQDDSAVGIFDTAKARQSILKHGADLLADGCRQVVQIDFELNAKRGCHIYQTVKQVLRFLFGHIVDTQRGSVVIVQIDLCLQIEIGRQDLGDDILGVGRNCLDLNPSGQTAGGYVQSQNAGLAHALHGNGCLADKALDQGAHTAVGQLGAQLGIGGGILIELGKVQGAGVDIQFLDIICRDFFAVCNIEVAVDIRKESVTVRRQTHVAIAPRIYVQIPHHVGMHSMVAYLGVATEFAQAVS